MPDPTRTEVEEAAAFLRLGGFLVTEIAYVKPEIDDPRLFDVWLPSWGRRVPMTREGLIGTAKKWGYSPQSGSTGDAHG